jgi:MOSC domain-containing protein YiiM
MKRSTLSAEAAPAILAFVDARPGQVVAALGPVAASLVRALAPTGAGALAVDGTGASIPLAARLVDTVVLAYVPDRGEAIRVLSEIHRVLRPGGRVVIAAPGRDGGGWPAALGRCALFAPPERHAASGNGTGLEILRAQTRVLAPSSAGIVATVTINAGGVPKPPVDGTWIRSMGLDGDAHREPEPIHGGPDQAVCVYAQEAIERVRAGGHTAFPGAFGENLTLLGIDWAALGPGDRLAFGGDLDGVDGDGGDEGDGALIELTKPAAPCHQLEPYFLERRVARVSHRLHPEDARWYARVLRDGPVAPGMPVRLVAGKAARA